MNYYQKKAEKRIKKVEAAIKIVESAIVRVKNQKEEVVKRSAAYFKKLKLDLVEKKEVTDMTTMHKSSNFNKCDEMLNNQLELLENIKNLLIKYLEVGIYEFQSGNYKLVCTIIRLSTRKIELLIKSITVNAIAILDGLEKSN